MPTSMDTKTIVGHQERERPLSLFSDSDHTLKQGSADQISTTILFIVYFSPKMFPEKYLSVMLRCKIIRAVSLTC